MNRGLGTQLRHIIALLDGAVADSYDEIGLNYRPRFTPVMKALIELETCTINQLADYAEITQPAATQTVKLMASADLIKITKNKQDSRERLIELTKTGQSIIPQLENRWKITLGAAASLDEDLGFSFSEALSKVTEALNNKSFARRIEESAERRI